VSIHNTPINDLILHRKILVLIAFLQGWSKGSRHIHDLWSVHRWHHHAVSDRGLQDAWWSTFTL